MRTLERIPALALTLALAGCLSPTEITVDVYTDVACSMDAEVSITLASSLDALTTSAPSSTSTGCLAGKAGHVGSVVIAPAGDDGKLVTFEVATRTAGGPSDVCLASPLPAGSDCIVARRQLRYSPHTDLPMRVDLRSACKGVDCPLDQTCVQGVCVSADVPAQCSGSCDETALVPESVHLVATATGFAAAWTSAEPDGTHAVRLQELGPDGTPTGAISPPIAPGPTVITGLLLGYDGQHYDLGVQAGAVSFLLTSADGSVNAGPRTDGDGTRIADHGLPWTGQNAVLTLAAPSRVFEDLFDPTTNYASWYWDEAATPGTTAFDGSSVGVTAYSPGRCWIYTMPAASPGSGVGSQLGDNSCANAQLAARTGGGFHVVMVSSGTPTLVEYQTVDATGLNRSKATTVSPMDGQIYEAAQVIGTPKGASIFFAPSGGGTTAPLYRVDVDTNGSVTAAAAPVPGVVVSGQSYELAFSGSVIGVAWYGRTDDPGGAATGIHTTTLTP